MRPSVSQLLSWQPARLGQAGSSLVTRAGDLQRSAADLTTIGSGLSGVWSGAAAQAATAHHRRRSAEVDELATVVHTAGQALIRAAEAIRQARTGLQSALAAASAAGCTVLDDGSVLPPARPPVPGGLSDEDRTAWQADADATAAAQAAGAARLAQQIRAALTAAGAADTTSAAALTALQPPQVSPPPQPVTMGLTGGQWAPLPLPSCPTTPAGTTADDGGHWWDGTVDQIVGFADGVRDGVVEPVKMVGGLVGLNGDVSDNWSALGGGFWHGVTHPAEFGKALIGWDDLSAGRYGHWAGELVPGIAAAVATGGAAAGLRGVGGARRLEAAAATSGRGVVPTLGDGTRRPLYDQLLQPHVHPSNVDLVDFDRDPLGGLSPDEFVQRYQVDREPGGPLDWDWPPNSGAVPGTEQPVHPSTIHPDRIGGPDGTYFGESGDMFHTRSLPPDRLNFNRADWQVDASRAETAGVEVRRSEVAPWFEQPGGGSQYQFFGPDGTPLTQAYLERMGIITAVTR